MRHPRITRFKINYAVLVFAALIFAALLFAAIVENPDNSRNGAAILDGSGQNNIFYVDGARADDNGDGLTWATAKKYIKSGISLMGSGDTLIINDGIYTGEK